MGKQNRPAVPVECYGAKYDALGSHVLGSSAGRGSGGVHAELRRHDALEASSFIQPVSEIAIVTRGFGHISRCGDGDDQRFEARPGGFCICPAGVPVSHLNLKGDDVEVLHLFVADEHSKSPTTSAWPYRGGLVDPLIAQIGGAIAEELREESAGGEMLLDALGQAVLACVEHRLRMATRSAEKSIRGLDGRRLNRTLEFLHSHVETYVRLSDIADEACLSPFHFARAFKVATGQTPFQYLGKLRLERAKELIADGQESIDTIASRLKFSNSANFSRAFRRGTGQSPSAYRASRRGE